MGSKEIFIILSTILLNNIFSIYGYIFHEAIKRVELYKSCESDLDCLSLDYAQCNTNEKCECVNRFVALEGQRCLPLVGGHCTKPSDCFIKNSHCVNRFCECKPEYALQSEQCLPTVLGQKCYTDIDCSLINYTECSFEEKCICKKNYAMINNVTCLPLLGSYCKSGERCFAQNSVCQDNRCQCRDHFVSVSNHQCELSFLGKKCNTDKDCSEIRLAHCSKNKTCSCKTEKISHGHRICLQVLGESCNNNNDCASRFAECTNYQCRCQNGYTPISDYECMERNEGDRVREKASALSKRGYSTNKLVRATISSLSMHANSTGPHLTADIHVILSSGRGRLGCEIGNKFSPINPL
ncbi:hypothetical protein KQX54_020138 [Cotesia glomerata]|uniref:EGF-like domain-containing protein n=1 Tax=Cotesia glomerata TaxID=32391 RepID=A0AAV7IJF4_COTGL|nr:hypothetical protein KQX54_020138 [Cotesia glomerata]